jgi:PAS domain S-box-containing protein
VNEHSHTIAELVRAVEREKERYVSLFDLAPDAYFVVDGRGVIEAANRMAGEMLGVRTRLLVGKLLTGFVAFEHRPALLEALSSDAPQGKVELRLCPRAGAPFDVELAFDAQPAAAWPGIRIIARELPVVRRVPRQSEHSALADASSSALEASGDVDLGGLRVLVVVMDDEERAGIASMLQERLAEVLEAGSVSEAVALVQVERPDVIVADINGGTGLELVRAVRGLGADRGGAVPAIALTGYADLEETRGALLAGFEVHVAKPIEPVILAHAVANMAGVGAMVRAG